MRSMFASVPVIVAAIAGFLVNSDSSQSPLNPFQSVERIEQVPMEIDTSAIEAKLAGYHGESMTAINGTRELLSDEVRTLSGRVDGVQSSHQTLVSRLDELEKETQKFGGAGFLVPKDPATNHECVCDCDCLDEQAIRKIVSDEFDNQRLAEAVAPRNYRAPMVSTPSVSYSQPMATYSQPVVYSQPMYNQQPIYNAYSQPQTTTTVRRGLFGRRIVTTQSAPQSASMSGTCRIVNGVKVCTP